MAFQTLTTVDLILFYHVWGPTWIESYWNSIWLRVQSHMVSHYTWGVHDHATWFWRYLGTAFGHFLWALTISWSWFLVLVWSGPNFTSTFEVCKQHFRRGSKAMNGKPTTRYRWTSWVLRMNWLEVQDFKNVTRHCRGIYEIPLLI